MRRRRRRSGGRDGPSRRRVLAGLGTALVGGGAAAALATGAYESVTGPRGTQLSAAADENAVIGLDVNSPVQKNSRDPLVYVTNNLAETASVTVTLQTCSDGTIYDPQGDTGCSVTAPIQSGDTGRFDIEAAVSGVDVPFTVSISSPSFTMSVTRSTTAEAGNVKGAVVIQSFSDLTTDTQGNSNEWDIKRVHVKDDDGDDDLARAEYVIQDSNSNDVGTLTVDPIPGAQYKPNGNPAVTIQPDDPTYTVNPNETYTATLTAFDADGNSDSETISTAE